MNNTYNRFRMNEVVRLVLCGAFSAFVANAVNGGQDAMQPTDPAQQNVLLMDRLESLKQEFMDLRERCAFNEHQKVMDTALSVVRGDNLTSLMLELDTVRRINVHNMDNGQFLSILSKGDLAFTEIGFIPRELFTDYNRFIKGFRRILHRTIDICGVMSSGIWEGMASNIYNLEFTCEPNEYLPCMFFVKDQVLPVLKILNKKCKNICAFCNPVPSNAFGGYGAEFENEEGRLNDLENAINARLGMINPTN